MDCECSSASVDYDIDGFKKIIDWCKLYNDVKIIDLEGLHMFVDVILCSSIEFHSEHNILASLIEKLDNERIYCSMLWLAKETLKRYAIDKDLVNFEWMQISGVCIFHVYMCKYKNLIQKVCIPWYNKMLEEYNSNKRCKMIMSPLISSDFLQYSVHNMPYVILDESEMSWEYKGKININLEINDIFAIMMIVKLFLLDRFDNMNIHIIKSIYDECYEISYHNIETTMLRMYSILISIIGTNKYRLAESLVSFLSSSLIQQIVYSESFDETVCSLFYVFKNLQLVKEKYKDCLELIRYSGIKYFHEELVSMHEFQIVLMTQTNLNISNISNESNESNESDISDESNEHNNITGYVYVGN